MTEVRSSHTTTMLNSGKVLAIAGYGIMHALASSEIYDPITGVWSPAAHLSTARSFHTATLLNSGKILVAGGE